MVNTCDALRQAGLGTEVTAVTMTGGDKESGYGPNYHVPKQDLLARLQVRHGLTGYARWGELPLVLLLGAGAATLWRESRVRQS